MAGLPVVWKTIRYSEGGNNEGWDGYRNTVTEHVSWISCIRSSVRDRASTYLIIKIHLQVVLAAMAPPTIGPTRRAKALVTEMLATNSAYFSGGTRSNTMIVQREKQPPPPMPWKARRIMLPHVSLINLVVVSVRGCPYSCVSVWAAAQPAENMMKMAVDSKNMGFLPKMSLNLAKIMRTAIMVCK